MNILSSALRAATILALAAATPVYAQEAGLPDPDVTTPDVREGPHRFWMAPTRIAAVANDDGVSTSSTTREMIPDMEIRGIRVQPYSSMLITFSFECGAYPANAGDVATGIVEVYVNGVPAHSVGGWNTPNYVSFCSQTENYYRSHSFQWAHTPTGGWARVQVYYRLEGSTGSYVAGDERMLSVEYTHR